MQYSPTLRSANCITASAMPAWARPQPAADLTHQSSTISATSLESFLDSAISLAAIVQGDERVRSAELICGKTLPSNSKKQPLGRKRKSLTESMSFARSVTGREARTAKLLRLAVAAAAAGRSDISRDSSALRVLVPHATERAV